MNTAHLWLAAHALAAFAPSAGAETADELAERYCAIGQTVVDMADTRSVSEQQVEEKVLELTKISVELANRYKHAHPEGTRLLDLVIAQVAEITDGRLRAMGPMVDLPFDQIEDDWYHLGYFKTHDVGIDMDDEDNEHFADPLHVLIHPVLVLRAARDFEVGRSRHDLDAIKAEMQEGMEQVETVADVLDD